MDARSAALSLAFPIALGIGSFAPPLAAQPNDTYILRMEVGERVTLDSSNVERFSESGPPIVDIRVEEGGRIEATALQPGQKRLVLFLSGGGQRVYQFFVRAAPEP